MSKIICDVCGTSYPETAEQCPICGCVRPADAPGVSGSTEEKEQAYTYVKGGRFSKANVRKRTGAAQAVARESGEDKEKSGKGLVITAAILLLAIIAVVVYIAIRFLMPPSVVKNPAETTTTAGPVEILCEDLYLDVQRIVFSEANESRMLYVTTWPSNVTEEITYESSDESIITVSKNGKITAVAPGEAWVTVTCGDVSVNCDVECAFELETTADTTDETTEETTEAIEVDLIMDHYKDFTMFYKGESYIIYADSIPASSITWTSSNESICTVENGKVVAAGNSRGEPVTITAEYNGQKETCIVRTNFSNSNSGVSGNGGVSPDGGG